MRVHGRTERPNSSGYVCVLWVGRGVATGLNMGMEMIIGPRLLRPNGCPPEYYLNEGVSILDPVADTRLNPQFVARQQLPNLSTFIQNDISTHLRILNLLFTHA